METVRIYFAPFHARLGNSSNSPCGSTIATFRNTVSRQDWPYDIGDDPSFYAMKKFKCQLSWGICRQDVRNSLRPGDIVVFFSFRKFEDTGDTQYRLCALATVDKKVSQIDIWKDKNLQIYTKYFNLLIRPSGPEREGWKHFEPPAEGPLGHQDWIWRIAKHRGLRKENFKNLEKNNYFDEKKNYFDLGDQPVVVIPNYVLFSPDREKTHVLSKPPVIACHAKAKGETAEKWNPDVFSQAVKRMTLEKAMNVNGRERWLRTSNPQRPHRHITFTLSRSKAKAWLSEFLLLTGNR